MTAEQRFEALADIDGATLEDLADEILAGEPDVVVTSGPEAVSAPVRVDLDGSDTATTVLGHVSLTRCTVALGGVRGDGMRAGYDPVGAVAAAICDAECERQGRFSNQVSEMCRSSDNSRAGRDAERAHLVAVTTLDQS